MRTRATTQRHPSFAEFDGWYNPGCEYDDGVGVLQSRKRMQRFRLGEICGIYEAANRWFEKLVPKSQRRQFDPLEGPPYFPVFQADDRSLIVESNGEYVTVDRLQRIQKELLGRYPLWRVFLYMEDRLNSVMIYPEAIRYANYPLDVDPDGALRKLVRRGAVLREKRERPRRAEISFLEQRLPGAIRAIGKRRFVVIGVLDNVLDKYPVLGRRLSVFVLVRGAKYYWLHAEGPPGVKDNFLACDSDYGVNAEGAVISYITVPKSAPFHVNVWLPPADFRGPLTISDRKTGERVIFEVKSKDIVRPNVSAKKPSSRRAGAMNARPANKPKNTRKRGGKK
ncbi:MAG: hypothetical protein ACT4QC_19805 [Planctomycetaceae bacterium]